MYDQHVPYIAGAMRADPDTFVRGAMFAVASIQQMFVTVPRALVDIDQHGDRSRFLFGSKVDAYRYLQEHKVRLHAEAVAATTPTEAILVISQVPGLGIVKSAFVAQLMGHDIACLDTRNIARDGRSPTQYKVNKSSKGYEKAVHRYVADTGGKAREYWDAWCLDVAPRYGLTGEIVSGIHLSSIVRKTRAEPITVPLPFIDDTIPW